MPILRRQKGDKPILAVDIDGVISLFGFDESMQPGQGDAGKAPASST